MDSDALYSETRLARELGISRTPLREALQCLSQDGYITISILDIEIQITDYNPVNRRIYEVGEKAYLDFDPKGVYIL